MAGRLPDATPPLLFMKSGLIGAEPIGFYQALASEYGAAVVSPQAVYAAEFGGTEKSIPGDMRRQVYRKTESQARDVLRAGTNVIYDGFLNKYERRQTVFWRVANAAGAQTILLCIDAPVRVIHRRLDEKAQAKHPDDGQAIAAEMVALGGTFRSMFATMEWPEDQGPCNEPYLLLDGQLTAEELIHQTREYVTARLAIAPTGHPE